MNDDRTRRRLAVLAEHVRRENAHDLEGVLATFAPAPRHHDESAGERHVGPDEVRRYYVELVTAFPDITIHVQREYPCGDEIVQEALMTGTNTGEWRGLPPTNKPFRFALAAFFSFDDEDRIVAERLYYDRLSILVQLGMIPPLPGT